MPSNTGNCSKSLDWMLENEADWPRLRFMHDGMFRPQTARWPAFKHRGKGLHGRRSEPVTGARNEDISKACMLAAN